MERSTKADQERYEELRELFLDLEGLPEAAQAARIAEIEARDEGLAREVRALLARAETGFLAEPLDPVRVVPRSIERPEPPLRERVGPYRILRILGRGASGVVYLAQEESPRRLVALKVLRRDVRPEGLRRFRSEAEVLARLHHPGIAQVYAAGIERSDVGEEPWFAMEYVEGRPLLEHARATGLGVRERVALVAELSDAVQAAHEAGVVHRDLKPDNVLVDARGRLRVLDFGVARADGGSDLSTLHTATGEIVGTVAYMSPEQAAGMASSVDARADVYALGVILYELVADRLPYPTRNVALHEAVRTILEIEPLPIRGTRGVDRDLETVVLKALRKEPGRRYASAAALAADLRRWLAGDPVEARPSDTVDLLLRLTKKHRGLAGGVAAAFVALVLGLSLALFFLGRARDAEERTALELEHVQRLSDLRGLQRLVVTRDALWPAIPARAAGMEGWLAEARSILARSEKHRQDLRELRAKKNSSATTLQEELVTALAEFVATVGPLREMEHRLELARTLESRTVDERANAWAEAIAGIVESPLYGGLLIEPQVGLVPLGPDPVSGLWEFAHHGLTGELPVRNPTTGTLLFGEESALVLVLLPGGVYLQGSQSHDPASPNYDPWGAEPWGGGRTRMVELAPFFLSKFELTQAQWERVAGTNPSQFEVGSEFGGILTCALHPVEFISWEEAVALLHRLDLELPTEAQWEYAARGGTTTAFWTGSDPASLDGAVNLKAWAPGQAANVEENRFIRDPWTIHCPVNELRPNPFGLHHVLGNVYEWCADPYLPHYLSAPLRPLDGMALGEGFGHRPIRGGNWGAFFLNLRCAHRTDHLEGYRNPEVGVRPARALRR